MQIGCRSAITVKLCHSILPNFVEEEHIVHRRRNLLPPQSAEKAGERRARQSEVKSIHNPLRTDHPGPCESRNGDGRSSEDAVSENYGGAATYASPENAIL